MTYPMNWAVCGLNYFVDKIEEEKRKRKRIDRIAWKAEAQQRREKGGRWK